MADQADLGRRLEQAEATLEALRSGEVDAIVGIDHVMLVRLREIEQALRASEERFRHLADAMPQLVWTARADGVVDYYNSQASRYSGIERTGEGQWTWHPTLHPDDLQRTVRAWADANATGEVYECEHRVRMADGSFRWHLSRAHQVVWRTGRQWFGTATDVHDLKQAQERLREADRRKDEFLAVLAHELRNPLAPLRSGLELLRRSGDDVRTARDVRAMMQRQVDQMVHLIDDLLDTSRIARGKFELRRRPTDALAAVRSALETSRPLLQAARHELHVELPDEEFTVDADPVRIAQVFTNLLNNAAHFTKSGGNVAVRARREGRDIVVEVEDDGVGIPESMLERVFEPFQQVDQSLATRGGRQGGLGLGLALARSIVELHGGSIHAQRRSDSSGSRFEVRLPLASSQSTRETAAAPAAVAPGGSRRVLVVDDNHDAAEALGALLTLLGHEVDVVHDGREALRAAEARPPKVVFLDLGMPGMDGFEVARRLRQIPGVDETRIVALSGYGQAADRRRSTEAGFDAHLVKPVDVRTLQSVVARAGDRVP